MSSLMTKLRGRQNQTDSSLMLVCPTDSSSDTHSSMMLKYVLIPELHTSVLLMKTKAVVTLRCHTQI